MTETTAPATTAASIAPPPEAAADMAAALADPAPAQPTIDTSGSDAIDLYQPQLKKGIHRLLCTLQDFGPSFDMEQKYRGWSVVLALAQEGLDEVGGKLPVGTSIRGIIFTTPSQYDKTPTEAAEKAKVSLMGLNNIAVNRRNRQSCEAAARAWAQLPPEKKLPMAVDEDASHYEQWKNTVVVAVFNSKEKDGETRVGVLGFEAASSAKMTT